MVVNVAKMTDLEVEVNVVKMTGLVVVFNVVKMMGLVVVANVVKMTGLVVVGLRRSNHLWIKALWISPVSVNTIQS